VTQVIENPSNDKGPKKKTYELDLNIRLEKQTLVKCLPLSVLSHTRNVRFA